MPHSEQAADLVITGARVHRAAGTAEGGAAAGETAAADAVAVRGGRIVALGAAADLAALVGPGTRVVSAGGGLVLPGFQDAHVHAPFAGRNRLRLWLNELSGRQAYLDAVAEYARAHPDEPWIVGGGWAMEYFPGGTPRREDLDAIVPDRPVFLFNRDVHGAWVNSRALELAGITRDTPDPADGRIERDPRTGEPSGTLHEGVAYRVNEEVVPAPTGADWEAAILEAQGYLHSLGITGWQDAWVTPQTQRAYEALAADGRLTARVVGALWWERSRGLDQIPEFLARREQGSKVRAPKAALGSGFHPTSVKIMADGVLENFTGALLEPYCEGCGGHGSPAGSEPGSQAAAGAGHAPTTPGQNRGLAYVEPELLDAALTELDAHGFQVHMHAIGDRAARMALDAVAAARTANGPGDRRHHIAHLQVVHPDDRPFRAARGGGQLPGLLGAARAADGRADDAVPRARAGRAAVSVREPAAQRRPAGDGQRLGGDDGAFTAGSAYVNHDEQGGRIEVGARADLVLLDTDVFAPGAGPTGDAAVRLTVAGGEVVYEAP